VLGHLPCLEIIDRAALLRVFAERFQIKDFE
jgi:hypothetical protein